MKNSINRRNIEMDNLLHKQPDNHLSTHIDEKYRILWCLMHASPRPCFSPQLLQELRVAQNLAMTMNPDRGNDTNYLVLASDIPNVFNLGGDLQLFTDLITSGNRQGLFEYAKACIDVIYANTIRSFSDNVTSIALVQGDSLGGGFEAALCCDMLIAERHARFGFPEILFNLFPGMGAFNLLSRKIGASQAEKIILSGKVFSAEEMHELGVVDRLAESTQGEIAVYNLITEERRHSNGYRAFRAARRHSNPIGYDEFLDTTKIWVDACLQLKRKDLRMMQKLISKQSG
jgi:DSF synthase